MDHPLQFFLPRLLLHRERGGELFVEGEEVFDALAVGGEGVLAVAAVHGAVERLVGFGEARRHRHRIIQVRQGAAGELLPRRKPPSFCSGTCEQFVLFMFFRTTKRVFGD